MTSVNTPSSSGSQDKPASTRRDFLSGSAAAAVGGALAGTLPLNRAAYAAGSDIIRVGLVGCGGRGTGAASQAMQADRGNRLVAMGDTFGDQIDSSLAALNKDRNAMRQIEVDDDHKFVGFDAYKQVIDSVDVVLLATPPHFRPLHVEYAVEKDTHLFVEKPVGTDPVHVRRCLEAAEKGKAKGLAITSGLCYRYEENKREAVKRIRDGMIGEVRAMECYYDTGYLWHRNVDFPLNTMEYQMRNWLYFTWLSGDHVVEQHIHSYDKCIWANDDVYPIKCLAQGGRLRRNEPKYGNIYDHFYMAFEFENGMTLHSSCRQQTGCKTRVTEYIVGTKGTCNLMDHYITDLKGEKIWRARRKPNKMYQIEHDELFASIRKGEPVYNGDYMCKTTLMGIMGRESAYTGRELSWEQVWNSQQNLAPENGYQWGELEYDPVPMPGITPFV